MDIHQRVEGEENSAWLRPRTVTGLIPLYRLSVLSASGATGFQFLVCENIRGYADMQTLSDRDATHQEGWRTLWLAIAGVMAITPTWNVLMLSLNAISY